jgi:hypothetical protein
MTKRERVAAALARAPVDRAPVAEDVPDERLEAVVATVKESMPVKASAR